MSRALILGAGFSYAVSQRMPLTDGLGNLIRSELRVKRPDLPDKPFAGGNFETWLSRYAEAQPDLSDIENLRNQATFLDISESLHDVLKQAEAEVVEGAPPPWLLKLVGLAHQEQTTIATFNYDTLIEVTANTHCLWDWTTGNPAVSANVVRGLPSLPPSSFAPNDAATFRLLKLHGSIDSFWVPNDTSGATISRMYTSSEWGMPRPISEDRRRQRLPGRSPFIIPPSAAKSSFYRNPFTREMWRTAAERIREAGRVSLVGYSLPMTDLVTGGMLADNLGARNAVIDVVNPFPREVIKQLGYLGIEEARISTTETVEAYVNEWEKEISEKVAADLQARGPDRSLIVGLSSNDCTEIGRVDRTADTINIYTTKPLTALHIAIGSYPDRRPVLYSLSELTALRSDDRVDILVHFHDQTTARVIGSANMEAAVGAGNGKWTVLIPSTAPMNREVESV